MTRADEEPPCQEESPTPPVPDRRIGEASSRFLPRQKDDVGGDGLPHSQPSLGLGQTLPSSPDV